MTDEKYQTTRRSTLKLMGGAAVGAAGFSSAATAEGVTWDESDVVTDADGNSEWILRIDRDTDTTDVTVETAKQTAEVSQQPIVDTLASEPAYTIEKQFWLANAMLVKADKDAMTSADELSVLSGVETVHPNFEIEGPDPVEEHRLVPQQDDTYTYGLEQINAPDVWEQFDTQGEGTSVAVLDTGIDPDHPDLELADDGWAFFDADGNEVDTEPFDPNGHGTHVSGTVAGGDANGFHIGVAPGTDLYNAKVLDDGGTWAQIVAGMEWAADEHGVDVINMSLGGAGLRPIWIEPVQNTVEMGTIVVSSSGNSGPDTSGSPGDVYEAFAIGASDSGRDIATFSSGTRVKTEDWDASWLTDDWPLNYYVPDVSAPGVDVISAYPDGEYAALQGTSMAAPHVAGAVALLLSAAGDLDVHEIKEYFETTAIHGEGPDALPGPRYGEGIIDALSAVTAAGDGNVVEGTVTYDGDPFPGATVETDFGTHAETDSDGNFSLYLADGEWTLSVDEFGYTSEEYTVDVTGGETVEQNIELEDELDVEPLLGQPDVIGRGETFDIGLAVANLESVTVCLADGSEVQEDDLTVVLGGSELEFCEPFAFEEPVTGEVAVTVEVDEEATLGDFQLDHEFEGLEDSIEITTGPTEVMEDPEDAFFEIVDWDETTDVEMGTTPTFWATVENTGDRTGVQAVQWWLFDPEGIYVFTGDVLELEGGEQGEASLSITIPGAFLPPGLEGPHGWQTDDDLVGVDTAFNGPFFAFDEVDAPGQVDYGDTMEVTATVVNQGTIAGDDSLYFYFDDVWVDSQDVEADVAESDTVTFEFDSTKVVRDRYDWRIDAAYADDPDLGDAASVGDAVWIGEVQAPPPVVGDNSPRDLNGDGLFEDVNGDGEFDIFDVQALFSNLDSDAIQNHPEAFNFAGDEDPDEVTIFDVQALFTRLQTW